MEATNAQWCLAGKAAYGADRHQVGVVRKGCILKAVQVTGSPRELQCIFLMLQSSVNIPGFSEKIRSNTSLKKKKKNPTIWL